MYRGGFVDFLFMTHGGPQHGQVTIMDGGHPCTFQYKSFLVSPFPTCYWSLGALNTGTVVSTAGAGRGNNSINVDNLEARGLAHLTGIEQLRHTRREHECQAFLTRTCPKLEVDWLLGIALALFLHSCPLPLARCHRHKYLRALKGSITGVEHGPLHSFPLAYAPVAL